jgi:hypothetical protein
MKPGDLLLCTETDRLAVVITPDINHIGWIKIQWVDSAAILVAQSISWKNLSEKDKKCP